VWRMLSLIGYLARMGRKRMFVTLCNNSVSTVEKYHQIRNYSTLWNRLLLKKLIVAQLVQSFPAFHGTQRLLRTKILQLKECGRSRVAAYFKVLRMTVKAK
jgi:hypothetical protein